MNCKRPGRTKSALNPTLMVIWAVVVAALLICQDFLLACRVTDLEVRLDAIQRQHGMPAFSECDITLQRNADGSLGVVKERR